MHTLEVCGSEKYDYEYRDRTYKKNGYNVIFVHAYKHQRDWKKFIIRRIMEIEEQRYDEVMKMLQHSNSDSAVSDHRFEEL